MSDKIPKKAMLAVEWIRDQGFDPVIVLYRIDGEYTFDLGPDIFHDVRLISLDEDKEFWKSWMALRKWIKERHNDGRFIMESIWPEGDES